MMAKPGYVGYENFLKIIQKLSAESITALTERIDFKTVKVIVEILLNILKDTIPVSEKNIAQFRKYKPVISKLLSTKTTYSDKKKVLTSHPQLVKLIANTILEFIQ